MEAGGSNGHPMTPQFTWGHATEDVGKTALMPPKAEKGELLMGPTVMSGGKSKNYSTPIEESISLVGKSMGMPETTSTSFAAQTAGVGQMKLAAPPQYLGIRHLGA